VKNSLVKIKTMRLDFLSGLGITVLQKSLLG
jgi:hypothetical protein